MYKAAISLVFALFVSAVPAMAHPPEKIDITYDLSTKKMTSVITHPVKDPAKHFIKKADIGMNNKTRFTKEFTKQDNNTTQTVEVDMPYLKPGDTAFVAGHCNISGSKKEKLVVK
jgi:hypothetical protein